MQLMHSGMTSQETEGAPKPEMMEKVRAVLSEWNSDTTACPHAKNVRACYCTDCLQVRVVLVLEEAVLDKDVLLRQAQEDFGAALRASEAAVESLTKERDEAVLLARGEKNVRHGLGRALDRLKLELEAARAEATKAAAKIAEDFPTHAIYGDTGGIAVAAKRLIAAAILASSPTPPTSPPCTCATGFTNGDCKRHTEPTSPPTEEPILAEFANTFGLMDAEQHDWLRQRIASLRSAFENRNEYIVAQALVIAEKSASPEPPRQPGRGSKWAQSTEPPREAGHNWVLCGCTPCDDRRKSAPFEEYEGRGDEPCPCCSPADPTPGPTEER